VTDGVLAYTTASSAVHLERKYSERKRVGLCLQKLSQKLHVGICFYHFTTPKKYMQLLFLANKSHFKHRFQ